MVAKASPQSTFHQFEAGILASKAPLTLKVVSCLEEDHGSLLGCGRETIDQASELDYSLSPLTANPHETRGPWRRRSAELKHFVAPSILPGFLPQKRQIPQKRKML